MAAAPVQPVQYIAAGAQPQVVYVQQPVYVQGTVPERMGGCGRALVSLSQRIGRLGRQGPRGDRGEIAGNVRRHPRPLSQAFILFLLSFAGVVLSFAGAGAAWLQYTSGDTTYFQSLALVCATTVSTNVNIASCSTYVAGLTTAACVLLVVSGVVGFFGCTIPLLVTAACPSRGGGGCCSPVAATACSVVAFILALAGTACGGSYFNYNSTSFTTFYNNITVSRPGFACAVAATVFWFVAIFVCAVLQCMPNSSAPKQVATADPTQFSGQNPNAVVRV